jgi:signal transduction histidine kinase
VSDQFRDWLQRPDGRAVTAGRSTSTVAVWRQRGADTAIVVGPAASLLSRLDSLAADLHVRAQIMDADGRTISSAPASSDRSQAPRSLRPETGLPWTMSVTAEPQSSAAWLSRQQLFGIGFGLLALVVTGASYTVFRFVSKELAVARLQSDFVSAVSHEFRTPLTALRHVSDLIEEGDASPQELSEYHQAIGKESRRLHGLVENLLDFGRIEEGHRVYDFGELDAVTLTQDVVHDLSGQAHANGHEVRLQAPAEPLPVRADRHAVTLALRNLIENAVKYSPGASSIDVTVRSDARNVAIAVQDYGVGVPASEQRTVFRKFVRGSAARELMVKGTGIGLAMADRIVRAHGGSITLESAPGRGSTFTISLPRSHA